MYSPEDLKILSKLGNHVDLRSLDISDNDALLEIDPEAIARMSKVSKVSFSCASYGGNFPFNKLPNLESLTVRESQFDDFSVHTKLTHLKIELLTFFGVPPNNYNIPNQLAALQNLRLLDLQVYIAEEELGFLSKLTNLENLRLAAITWTSGRYLQLINSSNLTALRLFATVTVKDPEYISHLTSLQQLMYFQKGSSAAFTKAPFKLTNVTELTVGDISISEICPNLKTLTVPYSEQLAHDTLASLVHLENLTLPLIDNSVLQVISQLTHLTHLSAWISTDSVQYDFSALQRLTGLRNLRLSDRKPYHTSYEQLLQVIRTLTNLEDLEVNSC